MIIGEWKSNKQGQLYRRRKSRNGNWYTQHHEKTYNKVIEEAAFNAEKLVTNNDPSYEMDVHPERWKTVTTYKSGRYPMLAIGIALLFSQIPLLIFVGVIGIIWTISSWSSTKKVRVHTS